MACLTATLLFLLLCLTAPTRTCAHTDDKHAPNTHPLPAYITGAANSTRQNRFPPDPRRQMMHFPELSLIASYLRPTDVLLEYGAGGSSLNLAPLVARSYAIDHNCEWARYVADRASAAPPEDGLSNLHVRCVDIKPGFRGWGTRSLFEHANYRQFREYVDVVETLPDTLFDKVLIDGRARLGCALKVLPFLHNESVVFLHDFYARTKHYGRVLEYYAEISRVLATRNGDARLGPMDEPQGLIVLRRRRRRRRFDPEGKGDAPALRADNGESARTEQAHFPNATEIAAAYDGVPWRVPFGPPLTGVRAWASEIRALCTELGRWRRARNARALARMARGDLVCVTGWSMAFVAWREVVAARRRAVGRSVAKRAVV